MFRDWIKKHFQLYDVDDLMIGGNCGCCGKWVKNNITPKDWPITLCEECLK